MKLPPWLRPEFLALHIVIGAALVWLYAALGMPPRAIFVAVLALGIAKEWGEQPNDFIGGPGAPWNGILDVLAFVLAPALHWILS